MKLNPKLISGFLIIALFVIFIGYLSISVSQHELENSIGNSAVLLGSETLDKIDRLIYSRIEEFQIYSKDFSMHIRCVNGGFAVVRCSLDNCSGHLFGMRAF